MAKSFYVKPTYVITYTLLLSNIQEKPNHNVYIILFIYFKIPTKRNVTKFKQQYYYLDIFFPWKSNCSFSQKIFSKESGALPYRGNLGIFHKKFLKST